MDREFIDRLNEANPIIDVARELGMTVPPNGMVPCLFPDEHGRGDKVASLKLDAKRNTAHCFGCRKVRRWRPVDLVRHLRRCSRHEAVTWLAARVGKSVPVSSASTPRYDKDNPNASRYYGILTAFALEAERRVGAGGMGYFLSRGISEEVIRRMHLGFVDDYDAVLAVAAKAFPDVSPKDAGLTSFYTYGSRGLPFVVIPYIGAIPGRDEGGAEKLRRPCVFLKARLVGEPPAGVPKYLATTSTIPFLYNASILDTVDEVFVAEGEIDTLTLLSNGYAAVGVPGAGNFKKEWVAGFTDKVVNLVLDADRAGRQGARDIGRMLAGVARRIRRIDLPHGVDVNEFFLRGGVA